MFYGVINTTRHTLTYASAGAPVPLLFRKDGGYEMLASSGMLLGIQKETIYHAREVAFQSGDCLLVYSDALVETVNLQGQTLTTETVAEVFQSGFSGDPRSYETAFSKLLHYFTTHSASQLTDDLTVVACCRLSAGESSQT